MHQIANCTSRLADSVSPAYTVWPYSIRAAEMKLSHPPVFKVEVTLLRLYGKRIEGRKKDITRQFVGHIELLMDVDVPLVTMRTRSTKDQHLHLPEDLYCPILRGISPTQVRLLGFEKGQHGTSFVQEWVVNFPRGTNPFE